MSVLSIGQVAKQTGVTVETVRFYEKRGLIEQAKRTASGYRQYVPGTVKRIRFIQHAKDAGFTLNDIAELLALRQAPGETCAPIRARAQAKIEAVDSKLRDLQRIRDALSKLVNKCDTNDALGDCPIIESLEEEEWVSNESGTDL
jgi:MerR family copper efflux transcriptional regulator